LLLVLSVKIQKSFLQTWERHGIGCSPIRNYDGENVAYRFRVPSSTFSDRCSLIKFRIGPEKGVIHIATGAVNNAIWDMFARKREKPLWKLVADMSPVCSSLLTSLWQFAHVFVP
jgi:hypothetical protein